MGFYSRTHNFFEGLIVPYKGVSCSVIVREQKTMAGKFPKLYF